MTCVQSLRKPTACERLESTLLLGQVGHAIIKTHGVAMKRTLHESLVDCDMALLRAVAETRGAVLTSNHRLTAAEELASQLTTPASLAIALSELSAQETEPLAALQAAGGWMEAPRFARRFGAIRITGPGRLEREQLWRSPANPAEARWYRALSFKGFRQTEAGVVETMYIPDDVLSLLQELLPETLARSKPGASFAIQCVTPPQHIQPANADIVEDVFGVLVAVRNHTVRLKPDGFLSPKDLHALNAICVTPVPPANAADDDRLALILHLCLAAGLVTISQDRLALNPDSARAWLQASPANQLLALQSAWLNDPGWNDLWHVPSLKPQPTGWKNDPVLVRHRMLDFLSHLHAGDWYSVHDMLQAVKSTQPDFQRPDGDYTSWYIHDSQGQPLMGFEHWDDVEGELLRYLISAPLHWLGVTDLGHTAGLGRTVDFRLADSGLPLLARITPSGAVSVPAIDESQHDFTPSHSEDIQGSVEGSTQEARNAQLKTPTGPSSLLVRNDFSVWVARDTSLYTRFQLARFADFLGRETDRVSYRISSTSLARARRQGITQEQISSFLTRSSHGHMPARVAEGLRKWYERSGSVHLEQSTVLRVDRPEILKALQDHAEIGPLLGERLGPQAVLIPRANVEQVRRWLLKQGYLEVG
jgi:hypothetical protein